MRPRSLIALTGALLALLAVPAAAQTRAATKVFQDYARDGQIDPCKHSSAELRSAESSIPPDIEQYAPDYPAAVRAALEARARGDCGGRRPPTASEAPPATGTGGAAPPPTSTPPTAPEKPTSTTVVEAPPAPDAAEGSVAVAAGARTDRAVERAATASAANPAPAPVLLLAILAALMAGTGLLVLAARRFGWGEERLATPMHAWREAGWRVEGVWEDFRDWLRLGR